MGGSGGHNDTAAGAKLAIVVTKLASKKYPERCGPGHDGNDSWRDHRRPGDGRRHRRESAEAGSGGAFEETDLPLVDAEHLKRMADKIVGKWEKPQFEDRIVAVVEYRDGTVIDVVRKLKTI